MEVLKDFPACCREGGRIMAKDMDIIRMDDEFNNDASRVYIKSYMFIKGYAVAKELNQTLLALSIARRLHEGQFRRDKTPYIYHPLKVCSTLISYGIDDDVTLAAALLHDVLEDCMDKLPMGAEGLMIQYNLSEEVIDIIMLLTKKSGLDDHDLSVYFSKIEKNPKAALIKLSDRLHNSATLYNLPLDKIRKYIRETSMFLIPMASYCKKYYPEYGNAFSILKSNIHSLNNCMSIMMDKIEEAAGKE